jgi:hypothetical protein
MVAVVQKLARRRFGAILDGGGIGRMAFSEGYRAPRLRDIGLALIVVVIALVAFLRLGDVMKLTGAAFYWLPVRLGLLRQANASQVWRYDLPTLPEAIDFPAPGRYLIYTGDYDLLVATNALCEKEAPAWLTVFDADTGERAPTHCVTRALRLYDNHLAPGRPVFGVEIARAGLYGLKAPRRPAEIAIVRDYVTGNEGRIAAVFAAELLLLAAPFALLYGRPYLLRRRSRRARQRARRAEADVLFQRLHEKRQALEEADDPDPPPEDDDPHAPYRPKN